MTHELSQVLAADAVRRFSQEEELNLKPERLLRMRWVLTWKYTEGGERKATARLVILGYQHPELTSVPTAPTLGNKSRHLLLQSCALHQLRVHFGDVSSAFLQTSASEEHQELTIKAPPNVGYFLRFGRKTCSICAFDEIVLWSHVNTPRVVVGYHTETFSDWTETRVD